MGTLECFTMFLGHIYHSFNNKQFLVATFDDIRGTFDSVNISTLISHLLSLNVSSKFYKILFSLFNHRNFMFTLFGSYNFCSTFTGLPPQGSCLSPLLFYIYPSIIEKHLISLSHHCLIYVDDILNQCIS